MTADEAGTKAPSPGQDDELIAALRAAAEAVRELPAALDAALDVLREAVRQAIGPYPPAPSPNPGRRGDRGAGQRS